MLAKMEIIRLAALSSTYETQCETCGSCEQFETSGKSMNKVVPTVKHEKQHEKQLAKCETLDVACKK